MRTRILITTLAIVLVLCAASRVAKGFYPSNMAFKNPVADGTIVILKKGRTVGAFILDKQTQSPELTDYRWFMRTDGKTTFDPSDPAVSTGCVYRASSIKFGPFAVDWSTAGDGRGYVYYPVDYLSVFHKPVIQIPGGFKLAVSSASDIQNIGIKDDKLEFKSTP